MFSLRSLLIRLLTLKVLEELHSALALVMCLPLKELMNHNGVFKVLLDRTPFLNNSTCRAFTLLLSKKRAWRSCSEPKMTGMFLLKVLLLLLVAMALSWHLVRNILMDLSLLRPVKGALSTLRNNMCPSLLRSRESLLFVWHHQVCAALLLLHTHLTLTLRSRPGGKSLGLASRLNTMNGHESFFVTPMHESAVFQQPMLEISRLKSKIVIRNISDHFCSSKVSGYPPHLVNAKLALEALGNTPTGTGNVVITLAFLSNGVMILVRPMCILKLMSLRSKRTTGPPLLNLKGQARSADTAADPTRRFCLTLPLTLWIPMPLRRLSSLILLLMCTHMHIHWSSRSCRRAPSAYLSVPSTPAKKVCPMKHGNLCLRSAIGGSIYGMPMTSKSIRYYRLALRHGMTYQRWHIGNLSLIYFASKIFWLHRQPHICTGLVDRLLRPYDMMMLFSSANLPKKQAHLFTHSKLKVFGGLLDALCRNSSNAGSRHLLSSLRHLKSNGTHIFNNLKLVAPWTQLTCSPHAISFNLNREVSKGTALFMTSHHCNRLKIRSVVHCLVKQLDSIPLLQAFSMFIPLRLPGYFWSLLEDLYLAGRTIGL